MAVQEKPQWHVELKQRQQNRKEKIINTYRDCLGALDQFFKLLYDEVCRPCVEGESKGYGCCHASDGPIDGMRGPAESAIHEMREKIAKRAREEGREVGTDYNACTFWEKGRGCAIPGLKSPRCVSQFCISPEVEKKYGMFYDGQRIRDDMERILEDVSIDSAGRAIAGMNTVLVKDFKAYIQSMIGTIKKARARAASEHINRQ